MLDLRTERAQMNYIRQTAVFTISPVYSRRKALASCTDAKDSTPDWDSEESARNVSHPTKC